MLIYAWIVERSGVKYPSWRDEKSRYMRWLEGLWEVHKFDIPNRTEREERKKDEVLEMLRGIVELSKHRIDPADFPPREGTLYGSNPGRRRKHWQSVDKKGAAY
jgi:hypothetical protein